MARIVNLDELVGDDVVFQYAGEEYAIPGDINVDTVFRLFDAFQQIGKIEGDTPEELTQSVKRRFDTVTDELLEVLRIRQPNLDHYPFGIRSTGVILREILSALGVTVTADPPQPANRKPRSSSAGNRKKTTTTNRKRR